MTDQINSKYRTELLQHWRSRAYDTANIRKYTRLFCSILATLVDPGNCLPVSYLDELQFKILWHLIVLTHAKDVGYDVLWSITHVPQMWKNLVSLIYVPCWAGFDHLSNQKRMRLVTNLKHMAVIIQRNNQTKPNWAVSSFMLLIQSYSDTWLVKHNFLIRVQNSKYRKSKCQVFRTSL